MTSGQHFIVRRKTMTIVRNLRLKISNNNKCNSAITYSG